MTNVFQDLEKNGTNPYNASVCIAKQRRVEIRCEIVIHSDLEAYPLYHIIYKGEVNASTRCLKGACAIARHLFSI